METTTTTETAAERNLGLLGRKPVITVSGAASTTLGPKVLRDVLNHPEVGGSTLRFVDINEERLQIYTQLAHKYHNFLREPITIESTTDRRSVLPGSDYVARSSY